jgi:hypothetical protein
MTDAETLPSEYCVAKTAGEPSHGKLGLDEKSPYQDAYAYPTAPASDDF